MSDNPITLDKEYQTRSGRPARVHATDIGTSLPVLASYLDQDGKWVAITRLSNGRAFADGKHHPLDLIEKPKTHKVSFYVNVYETWDSPHKTREEADGCSGKNRIACKRIEFEVKEGEYDD